MPLGGDCVSPPLFFELLKLGVPALLVVIGWGVVHSLQRGSASKHEFRKEQRACLDGLKEDIRSLRELCISYYVVGDPKPDIPLVVRVLFDDLRRDSIELAHSLLDTKEKDRVYETLANLGECATGRRFETRNQEKLSPYDPQVQGIFNYGASLLVLLENGFQKKYAGK